jgi:hypothetical protein
VILESEMTEFDLTHAAPHARRLRDGDGRLRISRSPSARSPRGCRIESGRIASGRGGFCKSSPMA